jgi:hypothetical protein
MIPQGTLRVGVLHPVFGGYWKWAHLACWCVPQPLWELLPQNQFGPDWTPVDFEDVLLTNFVKTHILTGFDGPTLSQQNKYVR